VTSHPTPKVGGRADIDRGVARPPVDGGVHDSPFPLRRLSPGAGDGPSLPRAPGDRRHPFCEWQAGVCRRSSVRFGALAFDRGYTQRRFLPESSRGTCATVLCLTQRAGDGGDFFLNFDASESPVLGGLNDPSRDGADAFHAQQSAWRQRQCSDPRRAEKFGQSV